MASIVRAGAWPKGNSVVVSWSGSRAVGNVMIIVAVLVLVLWCCYSISMQVEKGRG